jgi:hypothetical protein
LWYSITSFSKLEILSILLAASACLISELVHSGFTCEDPFKDKIA